MRKLPDTGKLCVHERLRTFTDVAADAFHVRMGAVSPRGELGMHRRVTHLSAELRRLHRVQAAVPGKQNDDDVDPGERHQHERPSAHDWLPEIEHRPVGLGGGIALYLPSLQPNAGRDHQQPQHERRGNGDEDDQTGVRIFEESGKHRNHERDEHRR